MDFEIQSPESVINFPKREEGEGIGLFCRLISLPYGECLLKGSSRSFELMQLKVGFSLPLPCLIIAGIKSYNSIKMRECIRIVSIA